MDLIIKADVNQAIAAMNKLGYTITKTEATAEKFTKKSSTNFTGLNRVLQDLPFGFIAISNNLEQLLPAAGALGLAFSAVVSTITFLQIGLRNWTRGAKENTQALEANAKASKEIDESAGKEIAHLITLTNAAKNTNLSMKERLAAVKLLQDTYPTTFANYEKEKILNGEVADAIQKTSNAIFQRAVVREKESELGPIAGQLFDLREQRKELEKQLAALKRLSALAGQTRTRQGIISSLVGAGSQDKKAISDVNQQIAELDHQIAPLQGQFKKISQAIIDASKAAGEGIFSDLTLTKVKKLKAEFKVPIVPFDIHAGRVTPLQDHSFDLINKEIGAFLAKHPLKPIVTIEPNLVLGQQGKEAIDATFGLINQQIASGFAALGESIGNVLAGGKNPFAPILAFLAEGLKTIGKAYIEIGVQMLVAKQALKLLLNSPILTVAAGIALVALGQILSAKANNIKAFATGGVVTKPTLALVGEQGPERITPLGYEGKANNNWMDGEVVFNISGQNLRGILRRADQTAFNTF